MDNHLEELESIEQTSDWSDSTVSLRHLSVELNNALNQRRYKDAIGFAAAISNNMSNVIGWIERQPS